MCIVFVWAFNHLSLSIINYTIASLSPSMFTSHVQWKIYSISLLIPNRAIVFFFFCAFHFILFSFFFMFYWSRIERAKIYYKYDRKRCLTISSQQPSIQLTQFNVQTRKVHHEILCSGIELCCYLQCFCKLNCDSWKIEIGVQEMCYLSVRSLYHIGRYARATTKSTGSGHAMWHWIWAHHWRSAKSSYRSKRLGKRSKSSGKFIES